MGGFILGLLLAVGILTSATPDYEEFNQDTVLVEIILTETGRKLGHGSGAVLRDGNVLTAGHVANLAHRDPGRYHLRVTYWDGATSHAEILKQAWDRKAGSGIGEDLSLLQPENRNTRTDGADLNCNRVKPGKDIYISGNPSVMRWTVTDGRVMGNYPRVKFDEGTDGSQWLQIDGTVIGGNSGGPVFTKNGSIVGIVSHGMVQRGAPTGLNFAVSGPAICDFLDYEESAAYRHRGGR